MGLVDGKTNERTKKKQNENIRINIHFHLISYYYFTMFCGLMNGLCRACSFAHQSTTEAFYMNLCMETQRVCILSVRKLMITRRVREKRKRKWLGIAELENEWEWGTLDIVP